MPYYPCGCRSWSYHHHLHKDCESVSCYVAYEKCNIICIEDECLVPPRFKYQEVVNTKVTDFAYKDLSGPVVQYHWDKDHRQIIYTIKCPRFVGRKIVHDLLDFGEDNLESLYIFQTTL